MSGILKSDRTVALDDVSRLAARILTIYDDLSELAEDPAQARAFARAAETRARALRHFNDVRAREGQIPETADPERAHLQALWLKLRSAVAAAPPGDDEPITRELAELLAQLDDELAQCCDTLRTFHLSEPLAQALDGLIPRG